MFFFYYFMILIRISFYFFVSVSIFLMVRNLSLDCYYICLLYLFLQFENGSNKDAKLQLIYLGVESRYFNYIDCLQITSDIFLLFIYLVQLFTFLQKLEMVTKKQNFHKVTLRVKKYLVYFSIFLKVDKTFLFLKLVI